MALRHPFQMPAVACSLFMRSRLSSNSARTASKATTIEQPQRAQNQKLMLNEGVRLRTKCHQLAGMYSTSPGPSTVS